MGKQRGDAQILEISSDDEITPQDEARMLDPCLADGACPCLGGFVWTLVSLVANLVQIVAAIVVLTRTKDSPEMFCRLIISYAGACIVSLPVLSLHFCHNHTNFTFTIRTYEVIHKLKKMIEYFFVGWVLVFIWHLINNSSSPDPPTPQQFWLCMAFLGMSCFLHVLPNFPCAIMCFLYPLLLRLFQSIDFFDDITDALDIINWKFAGLFGLGICLICCIVSCCRCS